MNKTFCPYAWNHFSVRVDGYMRLCCNGHDGSRIRDDKGKHFKIIEIKKLLDYYNLEHLKQIRKNMLEGIKNPECNLCYSIEENGGTSVRNYAVEKYPYEKFKDITDEETGELIDTKINYIDLAWSNKCNLQCRMCGPWASDQLINEYNKLYGPVEKSIVDNKLFWAYSNIDLVLESVSSNNLSEILVTGGEPLVNNDFYRFCEFLIEKDYAKNIHLSFHTNLTVTPSKWANIFSQFKHVVYKVSIDAVGNDYEYVRYPGKWEVLKENINQLVELVLEKNSNTSIEFHSVLSIFNGHCITDLLSYLCSLTRPNINSITAMPHFNFVQGPDIACPIYYPKDEKLRIKENVERWISSYNNVESTDFLKGHDTAKISILRAVIQLMLDNQPSDDKIIENIRKIKEVDRHRNHDTYKNLPWVLLFENQKNKL